MSPRLRRKRQRAEAARLHALRRDPFPREDLLTFADGATHKRGKHSPHTEAEVEWLKRRGLAWAIKHSWAVPPRPASPLVEWEPELTRVVTSEGLRVVE